MVHATARLNLTWSCEKQEVTHSRLDERFLAGDDRPYPISLPFLLDLHTVVERSWKKRCSAGIFPYPHLNYANTEGLCEQGYVKMPPVEETLTNNLLYSEAFSLKAQVLPSKTLQSTSWMIGKAFAAVGQAGGALHQEGSGISG